MYMLAGFAKLLAIACSVQTGFRVSHVLYRAEFILGVQVGR